MEITEEMIEKAAIALCGAQGITKDITRDERLGISHRGPFAIMRYAIGCGITEWHRAVAQEILESVLKDV